MKFLNLTATISVTFIAVLPNACFSQTLAMGEKYPEVTSIQLPNCYLKTSDNRILDLTHICRSSDKTDDNSSLGKKNTSSSNLNRNSSVCNQLDDNTSDESQCEEWAASKLPGVPY